MRKADSERKTKETKISSKVNLDGIGKSTIDLSLIHI